MPKSHIDELFREQLTSHRSGPPAKHKKAVLDQVNKKGNVVPMDLRYAIAASVAILIAFGLGLYLEKEQGNTAQNTIALDQPKPERPGIERERPVVKKEIPTPKNDVSIEVLKETTNEASDELNNEGTDKKNAGRPLPKGHKKKKKGSEKRNPSELTEALLVAHEEPTTLEQEEVEKKPTKTKTYTLQFKRYRPEQKPKETVANADTLVEEVEKGLLADIKNLKKDKADQLRSFGNIVSHYLFEDQTTYNDE